jgi:transcriptional regulator with XRE-family HTH domain
MAPKTLPAVAVAIRDARVHARLQQRQLAEILNVSPRTVSRWELGRTLPGTDISGSLAGWARTLPRPLAERLLASLGGAFVPPREPAFASLDAAIVAMAEELDVGPRTLRRALGRFLVAVDGVPVDDVRRQLAVEKKR